MHELTRFDPDTTDAIRQALAHQHEHLAQMQRPTYERSITARNYDTAINGLIAYMSDTGAALPTRTVLEQWRDDMLTGRMVSHRGQPYALKSVNAKLSAVRKLLRNVAADVTDLQVKMVLNDWSTVADAKPISQQDKLDEDYGLRLTLKELQDLFDSIPSDHLKGIRDRALLAVMAGAGLRVSEAVSLTMRDVFLTTNETGQRAIKVRQGKHNKARAVAIPDDFGWVLKAVQVYASALELDLMTTPDAIIFRGVKRIPGDYADDGKPLSTRGAQRAVEAYPVQHRGVTVQLNAHDLRRTYAKLCKSAGMSWEGLRANMGHSSVVTTENYVGHDVDWSERIPAWELKL